MEASNKTNVLFSEATKITHKYVYTITFIVAHFTCLEISRFQERH